jgi:hypothetical protein
MPKPAGFGKPRANPVAGRVSGGWSNECPVTVRRHLKALGIPARKAAPQV